MSASRAAMLAGAAALSVAREEIKSLRAKNDALVQRCRELENQVIQRDEAIDEWSGAAVQNGMECDTLRAEVERLRKIRDIAWEMLRTSQALGGGEIVCRSNFNKLYRLLREAGAAEGSQ